MGAAAAAGRGIDEVERLGRLANSNTRTLGVAFSGAPCPARPRPCSRCRAGHLGLGLGIHGEPGIRDVAMVSATELADLLVATVLSHAPPSAGNRVGSILDGLGPTKYEELFLLWGCRAEAVGSPRPGDRVRGGRDRHPTARGDTGGARAGRAADGGPDPNPGGCASDRLR